MKRAALRVTIAAGMVALCGWALAQDAADSVAPEIATGISDREAVKTRRFMVAAANPHAVKAGRDVLAAGGNAIDAMVAVQLVLGLVEPQSSGIGGGAFLVYYDSKTRRLTTYDGRETAPKAATPTLFLDENGEPLKFFDAVVGGRSVGTPGTLKLLYETHKIHGKLDWSTLVKPAIDLAETGFELSERLFKQVSADAERLGLHEETRAHFLGPDDQSHPVGHLLTNPAYAATLKLIAKDGADAFYTGGIANAIVETVRTGNPDNPGVLSLEDLANYDIKERPPVCIEYRSFEICGMGPPSSGALTVGQILGMLEPFDMAAMDPARAETWRLIGDASRLAFADRGRYMADSDFVPMPTEGLLDRAYLDERARLMEPGTVLTDEVKPGMPAWDHAMHLADDESIELPSTSHFSIVDADGSVISMTTTIENGFGSRLMTNGFLLNNELTDFSFRTHRNGYPIANRVEPGKRPRSSMSPTIVMKDGEPYMAIGSPGGSRIIGYVAKAIIAHIDWGLDVQSAINMPHLVNRFGTYDIEKGTEAENLAGPLEALGYKVNIRDLNSGLHAIVIEEDGLVGGADPRREGMADGQ
ncbi:gamma-glutamyltransferase [Hoeflea prorocentri]|uniref:Glutathione hydrolase proenzyme n=1 Tax=Hoeflea prorocentri TaxID=1922333 RepID=A0A9X3ZGI2_9HYPH|nr:gamma-glutamyltransferase [Hoeflea prorocentri]MCY6379933.1 gamma-glutamyltransferase [Hoeflea prorocentri]MDA5397733.1 gamma-glutamyltransferase [Hoeflea prorocentri]